MRPLIRVLFSTLCLLLATTAFAKESALRVGLSPDYPPLAYKQDGKLTGIEVLAAKNLASQLKRDVKFVEKTFDELVPALQAGEIDIIMSGMTITPERANLVNFTKPYLDAGQMAIIRFADAGKFAFKGAIFRPGAKVAIQKNTATEKFARQHLPNAVISEEESLEDCFAALKQGKVDFMVHDAATSWMLSQDRDKQDLMSLNHAMTEEHLGWAVAKDNPALLDAVNKQLDAMQKSGMMRAIINTWIPVTVEVK